MVGAFFVLLNLLVTPVLAGAVMVLMGKWHTHRDDVLVRLDRFGYGYIFALAMGAVRFAATG